MSKTKPIDENNLNRYFEKRKEDDADFINLVSLAISSHLNNKTAETFKVDPKVRSAVDKIPVVQKYIINEYFTDILYRFRAKSKVPVYGILERMQPALPDSEWLRSIEVYLIPFLRNYKVYKRLNS